MRYLNKTGAIAHIDEIRTQRPDMSIPDGADLTDIGFRRIHPALDVPVPEAGMLLVLGEPTEISGVLYETYTQTPDPRPPADTCSPAQGLVALFAQRGISEADIQNAIKAIPDAVTRYTTLIAFSRATEWRRGSPAMQAMASILSLTEADLDALFSMASTITV